MAVRRDLFLPGLNRTFPLSLALIAAILIAAPDGLAVDTRTVVFNEPVSTHEWALKDLNPNLPADWTPFNFLVIEFRASSSQRFELGIKTSEKVIARRVHPYPAVWVRAAIPLRFYRQGMGNAYDMASMVNQPRNSYWANLEGGSSGLLTNVQGLSVTMRYPQGSPTLSIRSVLLAQRDPGDDILEGKPIIDPFGQYTHAEWPGKAHTLADLKAAWTAESGTLAKAVALPDRDKYGGFASTHANATGYFRVERINGIWWFIDPDGHYFYSTGVNGVSTGMPTRVSGREDYFASLPAGTIITSTNGYGLGPAYSGTARRVSFYTANLKARFGTDFTTPWAKLTSERMKAWGLNTSSSAALNKSLPKDGAKQPYVTGIRGLQTGTLIMGMPDVYAANFTRHITDAINKQVTPLKDDPWLLGYFIGNEPPWPGKESQFVDLVLSGSATEMQKKFKAALAKGDTPEIRRDLVLGAFKKYLSVVNTTLKRYDPNHLNLGIRFGGTPPDYVVALTKDFDVYTLNKYRYEPPPDTLSNVYRITGRPILVGEFHIGVPDRGMAPGLVQAMNQEERGLAYRYYVEHAAAHPEVVGTHWFEWIDEPVTGRNDGENYNIGFVDVTDQPYLALVKAAQATHARLLDIHMGSIPPTDRRAKTSDAGNAEEANRLGLPGLQ